MSNILLDQELAERVKAEVKFRDFQEGIGIDPSDCGHPEGIFSVTRHDDPKDPEQPAFFDFAISVIDSHLLDPQLLSIKRLVERIGNATVSETIDPNLPAERGQFAFSSDHTMPAITLTGTYSTETESGFGPFRLRRTCARPELYKIGDAAVLRTRTYQSAEQLTRLIRSQAAKPIADSTRKGKPKEIHPATVATTLGHTMSIGIAELALQGKMPTLLFPERALLEMWTEQEIKELMSVRITTEPRSLLPYQQDETVDILNSNTRPRSLRTRQWANAILVSHGKESGQPGITISEGDLLCRWFNRRKVRSTEAKHRGWTINPEEFIGAAIL